VALFLSYRDNATIEPALALASMVLGVAILCFAGVVWQHAGKPAFNGWA